MGDRTQLRLASISVVVLAAIALLLVVPQSGWIRGFVAVFLAMIAGGIERIAHRFRSHRRGGRR